MFDASNTSFIPKKDLPSDKLKKRKSIDLFFFISIVIFLLSIASALGVFLFEIYLEKKIEENSIILERERGNFDVNSIKQLSRLGERIKSSEELLNKHVDLSRFFEFLGKNTLQNIQFKKFEFSLNEDNPTIFMEGVARNYSAIVLQSDIFAEDSFVRNPIFSNLDVNDQGDVTFDFSASIDRDLISFIKD